MSDLFYRDAVTEDGEPVRVREADWANPTDTAGAHAGTRPCSWALILPGDTVQIGGLKGIVAEVTYDPRQPIEVELENEAGAHGTHQAGVVDSVEPAGLTLVCGSPSELRERNPAWRWDR